MRTAKKQTAQEQEAVVFEAAAKCIEETSLLDFTMAAIGKEASLSIGSIYKHVQSKEDVLVALAVQMMSHQQRMFSEVMALPLTTPERLVSCVLVSPQKLYLYSFGVHLEMLTGNLAVLGRASTRWLDALRRVDQSIGAVFQEALAESWKSGELMVGAEDRDRILEVISIGLWSMSVGFLQIAYQRQARQQTESGSRLPFPLPIDHGVVESTQCLLDAHPWRTPLDDRGIEKACGLLEERGYR